MSAHTGGGEWVKEWPQDLHDKDLCRASVEVTQSNALQDQGKQMKRHNKTKQKKLKTVNLTCISVLKTLVFARR